MSNGFINPYELIESFSPAIAESTDRSRFLKQDVATKLQKKRIKTQFEMQKKRLEKEAKEKADLGGLGDLLTAASLFMGPLGAAITMGLKGAAQATKQQEAGKGFLKDIKESDFKSTFLREDVLEAEKQAEISQISDLDILLEGVKKGFEAHKASEVGEYKELRKSIFKGMKDPGKGIFKEQLISSFSPKEYLKREKKYKASDKFNFKGVEKILKGLKAFQGEGILEFFNMFGLDKGERVSSGWDTA